MADGGGLGQRRRGAGRRAARSPLSDERAYEILDKACRHPGAESLRLYKLYVRAQGFAPLNEP
jgi:hypothetical protein